MKSANGFNFAPNFFFEFLSILIYFKIVLFPGLMRILPIHKVVLALCRVDNSAHKVCEI